MKLKLTDSEVAELIPNIQNVLNTGEDWNSEELHYPVEAIVTAILTIPGIEREEIPDGEYGVKGFSTNGWQWDWWQQFTYNGESYVLSGSGYYGGHSFCSAE